MGKVLFVLFYLMISTPLAAGEVCDPEAKGLCPLGRVNFKTKTFKHLGNNALNAIRPLVIEHLAGEDVGFGAGINDGYFDDPKTCKYQRDPKTGEKIKVAKSCKPLLDPKTKKPIAKKDICNPKLYYDRSDAKAKRALETAKKMGCTLVPVFEEGFYKSRYGGEDLGVRYDNMKISTYQSKFIDIDCKEVKKGGLQTCDMKATIDLALKGNFKLRYAQEDYQFEDYQMDMKDVVLNFKALYDPNTNQFKIQKYKKGGNAFDLKDAQFDLLYQPDEFRQKGLQVEYANQFYDRLEKEYKHGLELRKKRNDKLRRAKELYNRAKQDQKSLHEQWKKNRAELFDSMSQSQIIRKFPTKEQRIEHLCEQGGSSFSYRCDLIERKAEELSQRRGFRDFLANKNLNPQSVEKQSFAEQVGLGCEYLQQSDPGACRSFQNHKCRVTYYNFLPYLDYTVLKRKWPSKKRVETYFVNNRQACSQDKFYPPTPFANVKVEYFVTYEKQSKAGFLASMKQLKELVSPGEDLRAKRGIVSHMRRWTREKTEFDHDMDFEIQADQGDPYRTSYEEDLERELTDLEKELLKEFEVHSYNPVLKKGRRRKQVELDLIPDGAKEDIEMLAVKRRNELFGDLFYLAENASKDDFNNAGWKKGYYKYKQAIDKVLGPNFFRKKRSRLEKTQIIQKYYKQLEKVGGEDSEIKRMYLEERDNVLISEGVCSNRLFCGGTMIGAGMIKDVVNHSPDAQEILGIQLTDSLVNEMIDTYNKKYSKYSPFGGGNSYEIPVPCVQCLVDYPILSKETETYLAKHPKLNLELKEIPMPYYCTENEFKRRGLAGAGKEKAKCIPTAKQFDKWLNSVSGKGLNTNPCIETRNKNKLIKQMPGYFGVGPRILLGDAAKAIHELESNIAFYEKNRTNTEGEKKRLHEMRNELKRRLFRIEEERTESVARQNAISTQLSIMSSIDIADAMNSNGDQLSAINLFSNLSCEKDKECVDKELKDSQSEADDSDGSIFLNIGAVNAYLKKLHDLGALDICYNKNGRTCAQSKTKKVGGKRACGEPKVSSTSGEPVPSSARHDPFEDLLNSDYDSGPQEEFENPIHNIDTTQAPQIQLDEKNNVVKLHGVVGYNNTPGLINLLDKDIDVYTQARLVSCPNNTRNQCIQNVETVAKVWDLIGKNIDDEMEKVLTSAGISDQAREAALKQGIGFDGMSFSKVIIHKCSIELKVKFNK